MDAPLWKLFSAAAGEPGAEKPPAEAVRYTAFLGRYDWRIYDLLVPLRANSPVSFLPFQESDGWFW